MQRNHKFVGTLVFVSAVFTLWLVLPADLFTNTTSSSTTRNGNQQAAVTVRTATATTSMHQREIRALGTAMANDSVKIVAASSDYITELRVNEGQAVSAGSLIAQLNDSEEKARVAELTAQLSEQKRQLARLSNLTKNQASAQSLYDEQQTKVNATLAQLDALNARLKELTIKAPFDGLLGLRQVSNGAFISAGTVITTLDDIHQIRAEFNVAEHFVGDLQQNMPIIATSVAYPGQQFAGSIKAIDPRIDAATRAVKVLATIPNPDLRLKPGMLLNIKITLAEKQVVGIAEKALLPLQNKQFVFVVGENDTVSQVAVTIGDRKPGWVEIVDGLTEGSEIVVEGAQKLRDGQRIQRVEQ